MNQSIFRAYDVRGIYPQELNEESASRIAMATARFLKANVLVVGGDARISTPGLKQATIKGITNIGCNVIDIGQCTTPLFYFSVNQLDADGGIMVTASHNPPQYGGFKIVGKGSLSISGDNGLPDIQSLSEVEFEGTSSVGSITETSLKDDYVNFLFNESKNIPGRVKDLKVVIDASNGVTPIVLKDLLAQIKLNVSPLYFDIDGTFPNHLSDTSREENLKDLKNKVTSEGANMGIAFDGDGDRMAVVDERGMVIRADMITALLAGHFYKDKKIAYDFRFSRAVKDALGESGVASKTGHSFVKATMRQNDCSFGGELSGHFFFKEMNYVDSAILAMLRLVEFLAREDKPISQLVKPFMKYANSGEINIELGIMNHALRIKILEKLKEKYFDGKVSELDGITVDYPDWWFNVRFSNTEPVIRMVVEANSKELMEQKVSELTSLIKKAAN